MTPALALLFQVPTPPAVPAPPAPPDIFGGGVHVVNGPPDWAGYVAVAFFVMIVLVAIGTPLARAFARRMDRRGSEPPRLPSDVSARLERIEQAVEAMAVEVERVSEGQRFLTKIMTEMRSLPAPNPLEVARPLPTRAGEETR